MNYYQSKYIRSKRRDRVVSNAWDVIDPPGIYYALENWYEWVGDEVVLQEILGMGVLSDVFGKSVAPAGTGQLEDADFSANFPVLYALMTFIIDDAGKSRQTCTLTLVCEDGAVKAGLRERNHEMSLWVTCRSLGGVFAALEEALGERPVAWKKTAWKGKGGKG
jgi:hypothetical protein